MSFACDMAACYSSSRCSARANIAELEARPGRRPASSAAAAAAIASVLVLEVHLGRHHPASSPLLEVQLGRGDELAAIAGVLVLCSLNASL
jgi:hypothetical protein